MAMYDRIANELRSKITSGQLTQGVRLPTESELMSEYGVSLATIRKALDLLDVEGLIEKRHGTGTFVREPRQRLIRSTERYQWEKDRARLSEEERRGNGSTEYDSGLQNDQLQFSAEYSRIQADEEIADALGIDVGDEVLRRRYTTKKKGERVPLGIGISYIPLKLIEGNPDLLDSTREPWPGGTLSQLWTVGIEVDYIEDVVIARPPVAEEAHMLDVRPGAALMALRKISTDTQGRVVEVSDILWPGDRIKLTYRTNLQRWAD